MKSKQISYSRQTFENTKQRLNRWGKPFTVVYRSSWKSISFSVGKKKFNKKYFVGDFMPGIHIASVTRKFIESQIKNGQYEIPKIEQQSIPVSCFSRSGIKRGIELGSGQTSLIDINNCYWDTLFFIGAIDKRIYDLGMKGGTEWKEARNATIGSFGRKIITEKYDKGVLLEGYPKSETDKLNPIRLAVLDFVWNNCVKIIGGAPKNSFCYFFTDCFFVSNDSLEYYCQALESIGYHFKIKPVTVKSFDNKKLVWDVDDQEYDKFYLWNSRQEISNFL